MKILIAASEVAPIIKIGGLGDVIGSLPKALQKVDLNVDVIVPFYPNAKTENLKIYKALILEVPYGGETHTVEVHKTKLPDSDVDVLLLKNAHFFATGGKNAFANNVTETEMFSFFDKAVVEYIKSQFNSYDVIHCNDWHTGLITEILSQEIVHERPATLITIHNLAYQGTGDEEIAQDLGLVPGENTVLAWDLKDGDINMLQDGIASADYINTVSPTYAKEILTKEFGAGLEELLQSREGRLTGIINGIDYSRFPRNYDVGDFTEKKAQAKKDLQQKLGLEVSDKPMYSFIGRLDAGQKGLDILFESVEKMLEKGVQFVLLGTGDPKWEGKFEELQKKHGKDNLSINIVFDVKFAEEIYSASDFLLVPSKYEPCGLIQMIAMWYGAVPVVHATGGLKDTVEEEVTGFLFDDYSSSDLLKAFDKSLEVYSNTEKYSEIVKNCMQADFSWEQSAKKYKELYKEVVELRQKALDLYNPDEE